MCQFNSVMEAWLKGRPPIIRELAERFPPFSILHQAGCPDVYVVSYGEDGSLGVSEVNPNDDYEHARATREVLCAPCVDLFVSDERPDGRPFLVTR